MPTTARRCLLTTLPFALVWATAGSAWAEGNQELQFRASATVVHDSNLFRLSDQVNPLLVLGRDGAMASYAALVLASALTVWWTGLRGRA